MSIDNRKMWHSIEKIFDLLPIEYQERDIYTKETIEDITKFLDNTPCLFFCDGGDKPRELQIFSKIIAPGSVICTHDWETEVKQIEIESAVKENGLVPLFQDAWDAEPDHVRLAVWKK